MKIGVIADIHNNLIALKTVVEELQKQKCDRIICCGDIIGIGPYPEETVQYMMKIPNLITVRGNHEKYLLEGMPDVVPNEEEMGYGEIEHHKWEHSLLSKESVEFLRSMPYRVDHEFVGHRVAIMHHCVDYDGTVLVKDIEAEVVLYGHVHDRAIKKKDKLYVNVGSLGCPGRDKNIARGGILLIEKDKIDVQTIDLEYDADSVVKKIDEINYPDAEDIKKYFYGVW